MQGKITQILTIFSIFVLIPLLFSINVVKAQNSTFSRTLKVGMSGEDVRNLQKILNLSQETAIRATGIGSPGNEGTYFGNLTKDAVIRFQEKYRTEILTPNGLSSGTGFVGPSTIAFLTELLGQQQVVESVPQNNTPSKLVVRPTTLQLDQTSVVSVQPMTNLSPISQNANPNQKNLDTVIAAIDRVGKEQNLSPEKIAAAKQVVIAEAATSTDLNENFIKSVEKSISSAPLPARNEFAKIWLPIKKFFFPKTAEAITGMPFGGALLFSMYCTQSQNWWLTVQPLPPSYATLLTYQTGTQIHLGYNIPFTHELLGKYGPGAPCIQGICPFCVTIPSQGMIYPSTGSSAI